MPETRIEKGICVLGILTVAALGFLVAHLWHHTRGIAAPPSIVAVPATPLITTPHVKTSAITTPTHTTEHARTTTTANTTPTPTNTRRPSKTTPTATGLVVLRVTASSDTWFEIRSGSSTGPLLYSGTLAATATKTFRAKTLWARFGAAGNLSARLDGKPIRLPSGTYSAIFNGHRYRQVGT